MKPLKITFALIFFIGIFQNVFSQQLKTYQGPYQNGNAVYQYYENDSYERVYQGDFKYTADHVSVTGHYDKGKRSGHWTIIKMLEQDLGNFKEIVTGKYIDGEMNGLWTLKRTDLSTKNILKKSSAKFISGYLDSSFYYYEKEFSEYPTRELRQLTLKGNFINGSFDDTWITGYTVDRIPFEEIRKYNGNSDSHIIRNLSTGEIIEKDIDDYIYSQIFDLWQRIKTPNFYDFEDPFIHVHSSGDIDELLKVFR